MYCYTLQDWITVRGAGPTISPINQSEWNWTDLTPFQDIIAWLEVKEFSGTSAPGLSYETSPTKDEPLFVAVSTVASMSTGVTVTPMLAAAMTNPLSRWLRWQLTYGGTGVWDATFRILVAANSPGLRLTGST